MAIYHYQMKTISRGQGRSATAAAAYRAAEKIYDHKAGLTHDYSRKGGVLMAEVITPDGQDLERGYLWNLVEEAEKRSNSTLAREVIVALPCELEAEDQQALVKDYAQGLSERTGWAVDVAVHAGGRGGDKRNIHAHILCTTRRFERDENGCPVLKEKTRAWDVRPSGSELVKTERKEWEEAVNRALERAHLQERVDCRSHAERETGLEPLIHLGPTAMAMERKGVKTQRGELYRDIARNNGQVVNFSKFREEREREQEWQDQFQKANDIGFNALQAILYDEHPGSISLSLERVPEVKETLTELDNQVKALRESHNEFRKTVKAYYAVVAEKESTKASRPYVYRLAQWNLNLDDSVSSVVSREKGLIEKLDTIIKKRVPEFDRFDEAFASYQKAIGHCEWFAEETYQKHKERYDAGYSELLNSYQSEACSACHRAESIVLQSDPDKALESVKTIQASFPKLLESGAHKIETEEARLSGKLQGYQSDLKTLSETITASERRQERWKREHQVSAVIHKLSLGSDVPLWFMEKESWFAREHGRCLSRMEQYTGARLKVLKQELSDERAKTTPELETGKAIQVGHEVQINLIHSRCVQRVEKVREQERELKRQEEAQQRIEREQSRRHGRGRGDDHYLGR
jgi:hypothetical protein